MELCSDRRFVFAATPDELWSAFGATDRYQRWWPWLTSFDADQLAAGSEWRCAVKPPLPYTLRFTVHLHDVVATRRIAATVSGDIAGAAELDVLARDGGSEVRLVSTLAPSRRAFAVVASMAGPLARRGHDWVLDTGARQFGERALGR